LSSAILLIANSMLRAEPTIGESIVPHTSNPLLGTSMSAQIVLLPVLGLAILTLALLLWSPRRGPSAGGEAGAPKVGLELQLLFYALIAIALPLRHADLVIVMLSWIFVVAWAVSAGLTSMIDKKQSSLSWTAAALILLAMWVYFSLRILLLI
jgi:hypothetical protein